MDYIEFTGKSVDEALTNALIQLETSSDNIEYEVVDKGANGFLGMFNKPAVIRARRKPEADEKSVSESKAVKEEVKSETAAKKDSYKKDSSAKVKKESDSYKSKDSDSYKSKDSDSYKSKDSDSYKSKKSDSYKSKKEDSYKSKKYDADADKEVKTSEVKSAAPVENEDVDEDKASKYTTIMPNEEIERRITTFLTDTFAAMGFDVSIKVIFDDPECVNVELSGDNMGVLIGKRGQTLDSIQYLTSLVVNKGKDKYVRIKLDTEDYRNRRKETLENLARNIAYKVKRSRRPVSLEPMNPYERRIIHSALQNDKFVSTKSEGEEPFRHVVVFLDREKSPSYRNRNY